MYITEKLYDLDCYAADFDALVLACEENAGLYEVYLDRTAFFPEGGGQPADAGALDTVEVVDVRETPSGIAHFTRECIAPGTKVRGRIDWEKRFRRMQNHTGEHIVSGVVHNLYGYNNVGFHMGSEAVTMDFDSYITPEELREIEYLANKVVIQNAKVTVSYPSAEELKKLDYRSKIDLTGDVRIVRVEGCDACACCASHVNSTGQVGIIKLLNSIRYKGGVRVSMLCGFDALEDYSKKIDNVAAVSELLSAKPNEIASAVTRVKEELAEQERKVVEAKRYLGQIILDSLEDTDGNICVFDLFLDVADLRKLVTAGVEGRSGVFAAFTGNDIEGYRYVIGSRTPDLRKRAKEINEALKGRGGGSAVMLQGSAEASRAEIEDYFAGFSVND
jgi:alanyl-tRNA synthetase